MPTHSYSRSGTPTQTTTHCKVHDEFELAYLCADCQHLVCPECIIHGDHHHHQVQTVTKFLAATVVPALTQAFHRCHRTEQALSDAHQHSH